MVKNLPAMQETYIREVVPSHRIEEDPVGWEDALEKEMATHFSILAWRIPLTKEPGKLQSIKSQRVRTQRK